MTTLIGPAGRLCDSIVAAAKRSRRVKHLYFGAPGVGKTTLANQVAEQLAGKWDIESCNGRNVTIDVVREWQDTFTSSSLFSESGWRVKVVNEIDTAPKAAQDLMLTFLDEMPEKRAFICTSNLDLEQLTERFRTRLENYEIEAPSAEEIRGLLEEQGVPEAIANQIAALAGGNVRGALNDLQAWQNKAEAKRAPKAVQYTLEMMNL